MSAPTSHEGQLTPSNRFLLLCARNLVRGDRRCTSQPTLLDWPEVCGAAERHQVQPALYEAMRSTALEEQLTVDQQRALLLEYHRTGMRNLFIGQRVAAILQEADQRGLETLLLKGAVLANRTYRKPEHRPLGDVDLLVRERDFRLLREILEGLGYRARLPPLTVRELPDYSQCYRQIRFTARVPPTVEVHFRLFNLGPPSSEEQAWKDARSVGIQGAPARIPSPERFLLHLCLHAQQHDFAMLRLLLDIAVWLERETCDAERFLRLARRESLASTAFYALSYSADLLEVGPAADLAERLRPSWLKRRVLDCLHHDDAVRSLEIRRRTMETELPRAYLLSDAPLWHKVRFALRVLVPPATWLEPADNLSSWARRGRHWSRLLRTGLAERTRD